MVYILDPNQRRAKIYSSPLDSLHDLCPSKKSLSACHPAISCAIYGMGRSETYVGLYPPLGTAHCAARGFPAFFLDTGLISGRRWASWFLASIALLIAH